MAEKTLVPTRKVVAGGLAGALTTLIVAVIEGLGGIEVSPDVAAALTTVLSFIVAYAVPEKVNL